MRGQQKIISDSLLTNSKIRDSGRSTSDRGILTPSSDSVISPASETLDGEK